MEEGAPGNPGTHVLKAAGSENSPLPQALIAAILNLYVVPGASSKRSIGLLSSTWNVRNVSRV